MECLTPGESLGLVTTMAFVGLIGYAWGIAIAYSIWGRKPKG
jgi:hypothetical protein